GIVAAETPQLADLDVAGRDDGRGFLDRFTFDLDPEVALAVDVLVHDLSLHETEGVEQLHDRDVPYLLEAARDLRREPVMRVHEVVRLFLRRCVFDELVGELVEALVYLHLRPVADGARLDIYHARVRTELLDPWVVILAPTP